MGAGAVEFDVRITADGHAVVMHDPTLDRTTDGTGLVSHQHPGRGAGVAHHAHHRGGGRGCPRWRRRSELLSGRAAVDVEIKNIPGEPDFDAERELAVEAVHRALDEVGFVGDVIVSSFNPLSIAASRAARPEIPTGLLTEYRVEAAAALRFAADQGHAWVLPFVKQVLEAGPAFPGEAHDAGLLLGTWITDDPGRGGGARPRRRRRRRDQRSAPGRRRGGGGGRAVIGRRKELPPELRAPYEAFHAVLDEIEPAKAGLADVLPSTRLPGRPLNDAVGEYRTRLVRATLGDGGLAPARAGRRLAGLLGWARPRDRAGDEAARAGCRPRGVRGAAGHGRAAHGPARPLRGGRGTVPIAAAEASARAP